VRDHARPKVVRVCEKAARLHRIAVATVAVLPLLCAVSAHADVLNRIRTFEIKPERLRQALLDFGRQARLQIIFRRLPRTDDPTVGVAGRITGRDAVNRLLRGTGLTYSLTDHTVEVFPKEAGRHRAVAARVGSRAKSGSRAGTAGRRSRSAETTHEAPPTLQQVIVTGTHISGGPPPSEPIITITRREIRESGYQSVEQLMDALPENFNSMGSEQNGFQSEVDAGNFGYGAAVDLLGLGYDSSLVLVNGHRLAPAGTNGAFTDISVIPLSAIKRIDIVTDGASAIYGADAVGGVVNYVLRNRQRGGETSLEYGSVTRGGLKDYRVSQSFGVNWRSGHALLAYEYHDETPLNVLDRPFSAASAPGDLTPGLTQNSVFLSASEAVTGQWRLDPDAFISHRRVTEEAASGTAPFYGYADSTQYSYALGSSVRLPRRWTLHARVSYGGNDTHFSSIDGSMTGDNKLATASVNANGAVYMLPAGEIKGAVGLQARYETLSNLFTGLYTVNNINRHRVVDSAFLEGEIPVLPSLHRGASEPSLMIDVAGRVDHYSDFGTSVNPRIGLAWRPLRGVKMRGTISSSFKAPNFYELYGAQYSLLVNSPEPQLPPTSSVALLYVSGSNPNLTPEKATEWTAGLDVSPPNISGLSTSVTYYHIRFKQRIADLSIPLLAALDQGNEYAAYIEQSPSAAELESWRTEYPYNNLTVIPGLGPPRTLLDAVAIVDDRFQNVGQTHSSGMLATVAYDGTSRGFRYDVGFNGAYIFGFKNIAVPGANAYSVLNTLNNPVNFKARLTAGVRHEAWGTAAFLNYVNHYRDLTTGPPVAIASWTTVNVTASYRFFRQMRDWGKTRLLVSCVNCFNRAPPAIRLISDYLGYDPANANALGRFLTATISVRW
jgi:iron complex outermembrane receptor protein